MCVGKARYCFSSRLLWALRLLGHKFIACCRMAGFNALRNSYRPLSSRTIAEFFNRFYYYFKELLVDFFFYPTFLRYWKQHKRLRIIFATFAAVAFGNSFFHLTRDWRFVQKDGFWKALVHYQVLFFYNVILAAALAFHNCENAGPSPNGLVRGHIVAGVWRNVVLLLCWAYLEMKDRLYPLGSAPKYLASLFFIRF